MRAATVAALFAVALGGRALSATALVQAPVLGAWTLRAVDDPTGNLLEGVLVAFPESGTTRVTGADGLAGGVGTDGEVRVVASRLGYADLDTLVAVPEDGGTVELRLGRAPIALAPLTIAAERGSTSRELHRLLFRRELAVGALGVTRAEIRAVPPVAEADLVRSLQALAGVTSVNDYSGELFVRGGNGDQVAVFIDGAPVFAPYHMFGLFGAFNTDAVESTEFYRGSIPARYGGALSGVVSVRQRAGPAGNFRLRGGLSLLGLRATADGSVSDGSLHWLAAGRVASSDMARINLPYSFGDVNFALAMHPAEDHRLRLSVFASRDNFAWDIVSQRLDDASFSSDWTNLASSATWSWVRDSRASGEVTAYYSRYHGLRSIGGAPGSPVTKNVVSTLGLRTHWTLRAERTGARVGVAVRGGPVELETEGVGGYVDGELSRSYLHASAFAELEGWLGPVRLAPGLRAGTERDSRRSFVEPRFSVRIEAANFALSGSLDRTYQFLSVFRDAYAMEVGAPMWFVHGADQPLSVADGASVSVDLWHGEDWTASVAGWTRRFADAPHWRPGKSRAASSLAFHDGAARGLEVMVKRHSGRLRGWISWQWARSTFTDAAGSRYSPQWDRRHEFDGLVSAIAPGGVELSLRATVGTGTPFWYPAGKYGALRIDLVDYGEDGGGAELWTDDLYTIWSDAQARLPSYVRFDLAARRGFRWGSWELTPYLSVVNVVNRRNVLGYRFAGLTDSSGEGDEYFFERIRQLPVLPTIGIDFQF